MKFIFVVKLSKSDHLKNIFLRLFILVCIVYSEKGYAQNCLDKINQNNLYSGSNDIINGRKWIYEKKFLGSPLLMENYWPKADISYKGSILKRAKISTLFWVLMIFRGFHLQILSGTGNIFMNILNCLA